MLGPPLVVGGAEREDVAVSLRPDRVALDHAELRQPADAHQQGDGECRPPEEDERDRLRVGAEPRATDRDALRLEQTGEEQRPRRDGDEHGDGCGRHLHDRAELRAGHAVAIGHRLHRGTRGQHVQVAARARLSTDPARRTFEIGARALIHGLTAWARESTT
ncbi:hypothetical protein [Microbacterium maritypicum]